MQIMSSKSLETESFAMFTEVYLLVMHLHRKNMPLKIAAYWNNHKGGVWKNTGKYHGERFTWKLQTPIVEIVSPKPHAESDIVVGKNWDVCIKLRMRGFWLLFWVFQKCILLLPFTDIVTATTSWWYARKNFWWQFSAKAPWLKREAGHMENKTLIPIRL